MTLFHAKLKSNFFRLLKSGAAYKVITSNTRHKVWTSLALIYIHFMCKYKTVNLITPHITRLTPVLFVVVTALYCVFQIRVVHLHEVFICSMVYSSVSSSRAV